MVGEGEDFCYFTYSKLTSGAGMFDEWCGALFRILVFR